MQAAELETDFDVVAPPARARRAVAVIVASVAAIGVAGLAWVHPDLALSAPRASGAAPAATHGAYVVSSIDFVSPTTGWLVADLPTGDFVLIHTVDGGDSWRQQLAGPAGGHARYVKFFDASVGVFAMTGTEPVLRRTADGGETWVSRPALAAGASALSWSFVDSDHGWLLATRTGDGLGAPRLYRTEDGGLSWTDLGSPVPAPDVAYEVHFSYLTTGWLTTVGSGPYAYRSNDFGATWSRVALPAGGTGWPTGGQFFVAVRPTAGQGVVAAVVHFPPLHGRSAVGGEVRNYPPLTVRSFDGGRLRTYVYTTFIDSVVPEPFASDTPPNETELGTVDGGRTWSPIEVPSPGGAVGFADAAHWWWIGGGSSARSDDGGVSWSEPRDIGVVDALPGSLQMLDKEHAWFAGQPGSRTMLESTDDGGVHWTTTPLPPL